MDIDARVNMVAPEVLPDLPLTNSERQAFAQALKTHLSLCPDDYDFRVEKRAVYCNDCVDRVEVARWAALEDLSAYTQHCQQSMHITMRESTRGHEQQSFNQPQHHQTQSPPRPLPPSSPPRLPTLASGSTPAPPPPPSVGSSAQAAFSAPAQRPHNTIKAASSPYVKIDLSSDNEDDDVHMSFASDGARHRSTRNKDRFIRKRTLPWDEDVKPSLPNEPASSANKSRKSQGRSSPNPQLNGPSSPSLYGSFREPKREVDHTFGTLGQTASASNSSGPWSTGFPGPSHTAAAATHSSSPTPRDFSWLSGPNAHQPLHHGSQAAPPPQQPSMPTYSEFRPGTLPALWQAMSSGASAVSSYLAPAPRPAPAPQALFDIDRAYPTFASMPDRFSHLPHTNFAARAESEEPLDGAAHLNDAFNEAIRGLNGYNTANERAHFTAAAAKAIEFQGSLTLAQACKDLGIQDEKKPNVPGMHRSCLLMPHQVLGLAFMVRQEGTRKILGGILADEMGLGKTVQAIALLCTNKPKPDEVKAKQTCTLLLGPLALLEQWKDEIDEKTDAGAVKSLIYHGSNKPTSRKKLREYDVILTTYQTMSMEWLPDDETAKKAAKHAAKKKGKPWSTDEEDNWEPRGKSGLLFEMDWHRIILDEAHNIRNRNTRVSRAVCRLTATYRWCLTGTPILNNLADAYSLIRFLRIRPYYDWTSFREDVASYEKRAPDRAAKKTLGILSPIMLRRKKDSELDGKPLLQLPPKTIYPEVLEFDSEERNIYNAVEKRMQIQFRKFLKAGTVLKNYSQVLVMLLRLRQICSHPALLAEDTLTAAVAENEAKVRKRVRKQALRDLGEAKFNLIKNRLLVQAVEAIEQERTGDDSAPPECPVCYSTLGDDTDVVTPCGHAFCANCIHRMFDPNEEVLGATAGDGADGGSDQIARPCYTCRTPFAADQTYLLMAMQPSQKELDAALGDEACDGPKDETPKQNTALDDDDDEDDDDDDVKVPGQRKKKAPKVVLSTSDIEAEEALPKKSNSTKRKTRKSSKRSKRLASKRDECNDRGDLKDFVVDDDNVDDDTEDDDKDKDFLGDGSTTEDSDDNNGRELAQRTRSKRKSRKMASSDESSESDSDSDSSDEDSFDGELDVLKVTQKQSGQRDLGILDKVKKEDGKIIPSTKMKKMMELLLAIREKGEKTIVFSQFTTCLDIIAPYLRENNIRFARYDGGMSKRDRLESIKLFQKKEKVDVMLMSIRAAGTGLNLTKANHIISTDLSYAPAVEHQAFDRIHRLGQNRDCHIHRLLIQDSIEDRLLAIQNRKMILSNGALGEGTDSEGRSNRRLTVRDLASLFGLNGTNYNSDDD